MGTCPGSMCHSARLAQRNLAAGQKKTTKGLRNKKVLRRRVEIFRKFKFLKFRLTGKYFSEIQKDGHFDEKERKNRTTTNIVKNSRTRKREKRSLLSWQSHTIRPIAERNREKGGFSVEGIFRGTLPCHKLGEITTLSREEHGSGGLAPQKLSNVEGLQ